LFTDHNLLVILFGYAYHFNVIADEMFKEHLLKASVISFIVLSSVIMIGIILVIITRTMQFYHLGLFLGFIIGNFPLDFFIRYIKLRKAMVPKISIFKTSIKEYGAKFNMRQNDSAATIGVRRDNR